MMIAYLLLLLQGTPWGPPPKAAAVTGAIEAVTLAPIHREAFACVEHPLGQLPYAGDALGTDCTIQGGIVGVSGFVRGFRTDGESNADWYGWHAAVLAPIDGTVLATLPNAVENRPGALGRPPAGMLVLRRADGLIVVLAHVVDIAVRTGESVRAGQRLAAVGNNGVSRAPHIHVGAYRESDAMPLQIRWDLRAMARN